ncbi:MAG: hypothetical protein JW844_05130 [Candidatus Omnitrophica bacterium]|nr:hypothetical protein [Candidatus Omnitrophota bacterium]
MSKTFGGFHSEWNLGSPGGWDYQRMAQIIGKHAWTRIRGKTDIDIELDFDDVLLNPVPSFARLLLRAHERNKGRACRPFIVLLAEEETLDKVGENIHFVEYLNGLEGVRAALAAPQELELRGERVCLRGEETTAIFADFNNRVILELGETHEIAAFLAAIRQGLVVNPRGMEPVGVKGVFEAITGEFRELMTESTYRRTPWTRLFYERATDGPAGEPIDDLIGWTRANWQNVILKPVHGYSGHGIIIGIKEADVDKAIARALDSGDYIVQEFIPPELWTERFPWVDLEKGTAYIKEWQTDFRCFVTDQGPIGFVTRFGGIPTNVGSGGGVQSTAVFTGDMPVSEAVERINDAIMGIGYDELAGIQNEMNELSKKIGNVYLLGPIMNTLRPRLITRGHIGQIMEYARNLWKDAVRLEELWLAGKLDRYIRMSPEEEALARSAPWQGSIALIASDGLFNFGGAIGDQG